MVLEELAVFIEMKSSIILLFSSRQIKHSTVQPIMVPPNHMFSVSTLPTTRNHLFKSFHGYNVCARALVCVCVRERVDLGNQINGIKVPTVYH